MFEEAVSGRIRNLLFLTGGDQAGHSDVSPQQRITAAAYHRGTTPLLQHIL